MSTQVKNGKLKMESQKTFNFQLSTFRSSVKPGFTLIEMMVAVAIFAITMMIGVGALLAMVDANRRAQAINSVMQNLNAALEGMSRSIRVGTVYHCQTSTTPDAPALLATASTDMACNPNGGHLIAFEPSGGGLEDDSNQVVYRINGTQLERSKDSGANWIALTAPEVTIDSFTIYLIGAIPRTVDGFATGDVTQPRLLMTIKGSAPVPKGRTQFTVQASVTQRIIDI
jgi:prepilin-type N-terminal cleavage/methylation domain-containing protein